MRVSEHEQYSEGWWQDRAGLFTASTFGDLITPDGKPTSATKTDNAINLVLASWVAGGELPSFQSYWMKRGHELEHEARAKVEWVTNYEVEEIGLCIHDSGYFGASPDGKITGPNAILELKCPAPNTLVSYYLNGFPRQYFPQVQGQLLVTGAEFCLFAAYHPGMPLFYMDVARDDAYIKKLESRLTECREELEKRKARLIDDGYQVAA